MGVVGFALECRSVALIDHPFPVLFIVGGVGGEERLGKVAGEAERGRIGAKLRQQVAGVGIVRARQGQPIVGEVHGGHPCRCGAGGHDGRTRDRKGEGKFFTFRRRVLAVRNSYGGT